MAEDRKNVKILNNDTHRGLVHSKLFVGLAKQSRNLGIYRFCVGFLKQLIFS